MRKLIVSEFMSVDGVMQDPGGAEKWPRGGWAFRFNRGPEGDQFKLDEVRSSDALLLGRVTYEEFARAWPSRTGEFADKMNGMPKYVVSTTLAQVPWNNSRLIRSNVADEVSKLKATPGGDILVAGSGHLVQTLMQHQLVDEFRLMVFPIILGDGKRLFTDGIPPTALRLTQARPVGSGVVILVYQQNGGDPYPKASTPS